MIPRRDNGPLSPGATIGILGGMGPEATSRLFERIIARALAAHLPGDYPQAIDVLLRSLGPELAGDELVGVGMGHLHPPGPPDAHAQLIEFCPPRMRRGRDEHEERLAGDFLENERETELLGGALDPEDVVRAERVRPGWDDKVLADWNGLAIAALVEAGQVFGEPHWIDRAREAFAFIRRSMFKDGRLFHAWRDGKLYVLSDWSVTGETAVTGRGVLYGVNRDSLGTGPFTVGIDSVALFESNVVQNSLAVAPLAVITAGSIAVAAESTTVSPVACNVPTVSSMRVSRPSRTATICCVVSWTEATDS